VPDLKQRAEDAEVRARRNGAGVLISTSSFGQYDRKPLDLLEQHGFRYTLNPYGRTLTADEFLDLVASSVGVIAGTESLGANVLEKIPRVRAISRCGAGLDNVDLEAARRLSISVSYTPDSATDAVAELAVGLILALLRKIPLANARLKAGRWEKMMGSLLGGKKAGILGFGRVGAKVGKLLDAFAVEVAFHDIEARSSDFARAMTLPELLSGSDILSIHASKNSSPGYLLGRKELATMKRGAWVINCARGGLIDEEALREGLESGSIAGAALDVFEREPYSGPLCELDQVILTPHIGSYALEARIHMELDAVRNLLRSLEGRL
jgi:D-3-phosphoglycerate dehydrogenase